MVSQDSVSRWTALVLVWSLAGTAVSGPSDGGCVGGGISISGSYTGSKWSVSGHVGSSTSHLVPAWGPGGDACGSTVWNGRRWFIPYGSYSSPYALNYRGFMQPIDSTVPRINPQLLPGSGSPTVDPNKPAPKPPAPPPTTVEKARAATKNKSFAEAIKLFKEHLKSSPDDVLSSRQLAVSLIESKDVESGAALLRELYRKDPTLAEKPYAGGECGQDSSRLRDMVGRLSGHANKTGSPSAWLAVVVLMQADGRNAQAAKLLDKAKAGGLESDILTKFAAVLAPQKAKPGATIPTQPGTPSAIPVPNAVPATSTPSPVPSADPMPGPAPERVPTPATDEPKPEGDKETSKLN